MKIHEALLYGAERLAARDDLREHAMRDAQLLLMHAMHMSRVQLIAWPERELFADESARFEVALERRLTAEPIQYIVGTQEFYGREFAVSRGVLIPRPETELLVDEVLAFVGDRSSAVTIADVGTGSGAIAVTLACELPRARIVALDISPTALATATHNASVLGVSGRVEFIESDLLSAVPAGSVFDCIVSNPPYIPLRERPSLHAQVSEYEPEEALFGGEDGCDIYRRLPSEAARLLKPDGLLAMEIGERSPALDAALASWIGVRYVDDLQGLPRVVVARRP